MDEKTYNEFLLKKYQSYVETLKKESFIELFIKAYNREDRAKDWWNEFNKLSLIDKIQFSVSIFICILTIILCWIYYKIKLHLLVFTPCYFGISRMNRQPSL